MAKKTPNREAAHRLAVYKAHQGVHDLGIRRRRLDQIGSSLIAVVAVALASLGYWAWAELGPGNPDAGGSVPDIALSENRDWDASMTIDGVDLELTLTGSVAPQAVANFISLGRDGFFTGTSCHRLADGGLFILQCGDPEGTGLGGPGYRFGPVENAPADGVYPAGTLAMARVPDDASSMGSQFFIVWDDSTIPADSAGGYTVFGRVTAGLDELIDTVVSQGVVGGESDGEPVAEALIGNITIR